jgi:hypothetical protein
MSRTTRTSLVLLPLLALPLASPARASQYLTLTAPAPNSTLGPTAQTVTFSYVIDANGLRQHDQRKLLGTWITVCTGACADAADIIDSHKLTASEQTTTSLPVSKINQHLTRHNLPLSTKIKWRLAFHVYEVAVIIWGGGTAEGPVEEEKSESDFYLARLEAAGGAVPQAKPVASPTPAPSSQKPPR